MSELHQAESDEARAQRIVSDILTLPPDLAGRVLVQAGSALVITIPGEPPSDFNALLKLGSYLHEKGQLLKSLPPSPSEESRKRAARLLRLKDGLSGPERALVAAVQLFHTHQPKVTPRDITLVNNEAETVFIKNITTTVAAAIKDGTLEEFEDEGRSKYMVTPKGFIRFDEKYRSLKSEVDTIEMDRVSPKVKEHSLN